jgi:hypothetical protein
MMRKAILLLVTVLSAAVQKMTMPIAASLACQHLQNQMLYNQQQIRAKLNQMFYSNQTGKNWKA